MASTRRLIHVPDWLWTRALALAAAERGNKGASSRTTSASRVVIEAATGKRPPLTEE